MGVAAHLGIDLAQYDARIRTFIPHYEEMLDVAASAIHPDSGIVVDLGVGTGALSARCQSFAPTAKFLGIDSDPEMLKAAEKRVSGAQFICSSFLRCEIPPCDAVVASFALHHVRTRSAKGALYQRIAAALHSGGQIVNVDCQPAQEKRIAQRQFEAWKAHLRLSYDEQQSRDYLAAWAKEDVYVPLASEMALMTNAGFSVEVLWRKDAFAVLEGTRS
jgi:trans-aconitate methyltransferase